MVIIAQYLFVHCYNGFHLEMIGNVCQKNVKGYLFQIVGCFGKPEYIIFDKYLDIHYI